jgi:hypothetical protein
MPHQSENFSFALFEASNASNLFHDAPQNLIPEELKKIAD